MNTMFTLVVALGLLGLASSWFLAPEAWAQLLLRAGRKASALRSHRTEAAGLNWHYLTGGKGPVLLAVHGFGGDADHWLRVAPALRRHFQILAPDLVGFGSSDPGDQLPFDIDAQVDRLIALTERLGIQEFIIAGSSMGGWIASRLAERYPERVRALWLLAPLGVRDCERGELLRRIDRDQVSPLSVGSVEDFDKLVYRPMFARPPRLPRPLKLHYGHQAVGRAEASRRMFAEVAASEPALEESLAKLTLPVLLQWGTEDRAVHVSGAEKLRESLKDGTVILQPNVGHLPMLEAPQLTVRQFIDFAARHGLMRMPG